MRGAVRVLIADDELAVRSSISRALELKGYRVGTAAGGHEALARLSESSFDALVLDLMMPGVDGLDVCRRMRAGGDGTPVLMLTARDAVGDRVAGLDAGADDYLVKPFALEELLARLRALVRRAPSNGDRPAVLRFSTSPLTPAPTRSGGAIGRSSSPARSSFYSSCSFATHVRC